MIDNILASIIEIPRYSDNKSRIHGLYLDIFDRGATEVLGLISRHLLSTRETREQTLEFELIYFFLCTTHLRRFMRPVSECPQEAKDAGEAMA